jgi:unsaturated rhamnogalacturonyl hydrolase
VNRFTVLGCLVSVVAAGTGCGAGAAEPERAQAAAEPVCVKAARPAAAHFANEVTARAVADGWIARHAPESMHWDWGPAVLAYGVLDLYERTGDERYLRYVQAWLKSHADTFPMIWSDTVAPTSAAARVARYTCDAALLTEIARAYAYLQTAPRTAHGGIGHLGILQPERPELWVDSLFMFGGLLLNRAALFEAPADLDWFTDQALIFAAELQDESGLFRHALVNERPWPASPVFWGRGNGWVANILGRLLAALPAAHPRRAELARVEGRLLAAVMGAQNTTGLWNTVLVPGGESYDETSASALFADALERGAALGVVAAPQARAAAARARAAVLAQVATVNGLAVVRGTSTATQPGGRAYYDGIPVEDDVHYGVGSVLLMLTGSRD